MFDNFILLFKSKVKKPGIRGGVYWIDDKGEIRYDDKPKGKVLSKEKKLSAKDVIGIIKNKEVVEHMFRVVEKLKMNSTRLKRIKKFSELAEKHDWAKLGLFYYIIKVLKKNKKIPKGKFIEKDVKKEFKKGYKEYKALKEKKVEEKKPKENKVKLVIKKEEKVHEDINEVVKDADETKEGKKDISKKPEEIMEDLFGKNKDKDNLYYSDKPKFEKVEPGMIVYHKDKIEKGPMMLLRKFRDTKDKKMGITYFGFASDKNTYILNEEGVRVAVDQEPKGIDLDIASELMDRFKKSFMYLSLIKSKQKRHKRIRKGKMYFAGKGEELNYDNEEIERAARRVMKEELIPKLYPGRNPKTIKFSGSTIDNMGTKQLSKLFDEFTLEIKVKKMTGQPIARKTITAEYIDKIKDNAVKAILVFSQTYGWNEEAIDNYISAHYPDIDDGYVEDIMNKVREEYNKWYNVEEQNGASKVPLVQVTPGIPETPIQKADKMEHPKKQKMSIKPEKPKVARKKGPGSKGGKYWIDKKGNVRYDEKPKGRSGAKMVMKEAGEYAHAAEEVGKDIGRGVGKGVSGIVGKGMNLLSTAIKRLNTLIRTGEPLAVASEQIQESAAKRESKARGLEKQGKKEEAAKLRAEKDTKKGINDKDADKIDKKMRNDLKSLVRIANRGIELAKRSKEHGGKSVVTWKRQSDDLILKARKLHSKIIEGYDDIPKEVSDALEEVDKGMFEVKHVDEKKEEFDVHKEKKGEEYETGRAEVEAKNVKRKEVINNLLTNYKKYTKNFIVNNDYRALKVSAEEVYRFSMITKDDKERNRLLNVSYKLEMNSKQAKQRAMENLSGRKIKMKKSMVISNKELLK